MSSVPPEIMNHLRAQLHKNNPSGEVGTPSLPRTTEGDAAPKVEAASGDEQGRIKGMLSRFALRATGSELTGE